MMGQDKNPDSVERFGDRFIAIVRHNKVKEPFDRWYVIRAKEYIKFYDGKRLQQHSRQDVVDWLHVLGRRDDLKDWQFKQPVHAIQILFCQLIENLVRLDKLTNRTGQKGTLLLYYLK